MKRRTLRVCQRRQRTTLRQLRCSFQVILYTNNSIHILLCYALNHLSNFRIFPKFELKYNPTRISLFRVVDDLDAIWIEDADALAIISFLPIDLINVNMSRNSSDFKSQRSK